MITDKDIDVILNWCYENNIIELKNSKLKIAITDGGWVNCIKLKSFLNEIKEQGK